MATGTTAVQLNNEQRKAITHGDGPLLIVAGAGTGKTTVITQRILWLLQDQKVRPENILALTFTEKAAEEMIERIDRALPYGYTTLWTSTFHAFCQRIVQEHALDIGVPNDFRLMNTTDAWLLVRKNLDQFHLDYYRPLGNPTKFIHALLKHFSRCKDEGVGPEEYLEYAKTLRLNTDNSDIKASCWSGASAEGIKEIGENGNKETYHAARMQEIARVQEIADAYHIYQRILLENSALDFGDLLGYALRLFRGREAILQKYRDRFQYILVDEFQDTNWTQYELVKLLASPKNNITVVSDDDQAIYRWRGASYNNVVVFARDYPNATKVSLVQNYRSRQNILDLAYMFIQRNNPNRLEAQLAEGKTELGIITKKLTAERGGAAPIAHLRGKTEFDEAQMVAKKIVELHAQPLVSWSDFCILVRANAMAEPFIRALEREGIPYQFLASRGLYAKPVILDCVAYLKLLDDYHESAAFYRMLTSPVVGLVPDDCVRLTHYAGKKNVSLYEAARIAPAVGLSREGILQCAKLLALIARGASLARTRPVGEVLYAFLEDSGYLKEITKRVQHAGASAQRDIDRVRHLEQFFKMIAAFESTEREPTVKHFLSAFEYAAEAGDEGVLDADLESGPDTVKIMTIHGAKGLEFPYVFIVQLVELRFPSVDRRDPIILPDSLVKEILPEGDEHLEEERRLFYVGMTRARDGLFFTSAEDYGGMRKKRPSSFLFEIGMLKKEKDAIKAMHSPSKIISNFQFPISKQILNSVSQPTLLPLPEKFSYTQLKAFETCPLQYKFAHILKIPVRGRFTFSFGKTMHTTLQTLFQRIMDGANKEQQDLFGEKNPKFQIPNSVPTFEELLKIYDESWIDDWYDSKQHETEYYEKGKEILKEFYTLYKEKWPNTLALEQPFTMKVGAYTIKGVIDRIDRVTDGKRTGVSIVDYKTGNVPKDARLLEKEQLFLYQIAVEDVLRETPLLCTYYYLSGQKAFSFLGTAEEIEAFRAKMLATITAIQRSDFAATPSPQKCRNCDFKEICEYRKL